MVYLALGLLAISVTGYVYSYGRPNLPRRYAEHSSNPVLKAQSAQPDKKDSGSSRRDENTSTEKRDNQPKQLRTELQCALREERRESAQTLSQTTPRAGSQHVRDGDIPCLTLDGVVEVDSGYPISPTQTQERRLLGSSTIAPKGNPQSQPSPDLQPSMPPPPRPTSTARRKLENSSSNLMPPPSRKPPTTNRAPPKPSSTLLPPPSAASTLRTLPSRSLAPTASSLPPSSRPSKKVLLAPGHSPLDWAHLVTSPPTPTFLRGASVPPQLIRVPPSLLKYHNGRKGKDAWGVWQGKVYNMTPYMDFHPGGVDQLMKGAGREGAEKMFLEVHPWVSWEAMLGECLVGIVVSEEEGKGEGPMEEMD